MESEFFMGNNLENFIEKGKETLENIKNDIGEITTNLKEKQNEFLRSDLGQAIDGGINVGLKAVLPDVIEDEVIAIKDSLITEGFSAAVDTAIDEAINLGKSAIGLVTGNFENISQIKKAVEKGGLIDSVSDILDSGINWLKEKGYIKKETANSIKKGKNTIMNTIENNVESTLENQVEAIEKIDGYIEKWQEYYEKQDFSNMEYQYKKIEEYLDKVVPLEETLIKAREVENLHELIKNNGKNFDLTNEEKELATMLTN